MTTYIANIVDSTEGLHSNFTLTASSQEEAFVIARKEVAARNDDPANWAEWILIEVMPTQEEAPAAATITAPPTTDQIKEYMEGELEFHIDAYTDKVNMTSLAEDAINHFSHTYQETDRYYEIAFEIVEAIEAE